ncbi:CLUMA_CG007394, isoform A [Clunio marinus]|uniref:CLUMA_CG007394, isoform A n=1 Tax=Clunio marinus TaxID=568069 RepID=A0A1J1I0Y7_9DIPT|nr:CLUMA_CG007394, isoform A [Clunio marinus]
MKRVESRWQLTFNFNSTVYLFILLSFLRRQQNKAGCAINKTLLKSHCLKAKATHSIAMIAIIHMNALLQTTNVHLGMSFRHD